MKQVSTQAAWRVGLGIVASASLLLAGCSSSPNSTSAQSSSSSPAASAATSAKLAAPAATPAVAKGTEHAIGDVPWSQVGQRRSQREISRRKKSGVINRMSK